MELGRPRGTQPNPGSWNGRKFPRVNRDEVGIFINELLLENEGRRGKQTKDKSRVQVSIECACFVRILWGTLVP